MKVQIRRGAFETNSSSQHTLVLRKTNAEESWESLRNSQSEITVGLTTLSEINELECGFVSNIGELDLQKRIDVLFYSRFKTYSPIECYREISYLVQMFKEEGINVRLELDNVLNDEDNIWCITNGELVDMIYKEVNLKVEVEQFLFSKECYFTSYADDCGDEPKSIREIFDYFLTLPGDEVMVAHDRS